MPRPTVFVDVYRTYFKSADKLLYIRRMSETVMNAERHTLPNGGDRNKNTVTSSADIKYSAFRVESPRWSSGVLECC